MGKTKRKIYEALVAGAAGGLHSAPLYAYVANKVPKSDNRKIIRAALQALRDPDMTDPVSLKTICSLALERRLIDLGLSAENAKPKHRKSHPDPT